MSCFNSISKVHVKTQSESAQSWLLALKDRSDELVTFEHFASASVSFFDQLTASGTIGDGELVNYPSSSVYNAEYRWGESDLSLATGSYIVRVSMMSGSDEWVFPQGNLSRFNLQIVP